MAIWQTFDPQTFNLQMVWRLRYTPSSPRWVGRDWPWGLLLLWSVDGFAHHAQATMCVNYATLLCLSKYFKNVDLTGYSNDEIDLNKRFKPKKTPKTFGNLAKRMSAYSSAKDVITWLIDGKRNLKFKKKLGNQTQQIENSPVKSWLFVVKTAEFLWSFKQ